MAEDFTAKKAEAAAWFRSLRDQIVASFEGLEDRFGQGTPGRFEVTPTVRADGGGGLMSVMRGGRVFEKVGVNVSEVHGTLGERAQKAMAARGVPGMDSDPRFWASGISLVAHMANPHVPAVHMNTRFLTTTKAWFGGGADLNPPIPYDEDTAEFHAAFKAACDAHDPEYYPRFKAWADEYFFVPHRGRARGVGGIVRHARRLAVHPMEGAPRLRRRRERGSDPAIRGAGRCARGSPRAAAGPRLALPRRPRAGGWPDRGRPSWGCWCATPARVGTAGR